MSDLENDLEQRMRRVRLRTPSDDLDERVLGQMPPAGGARQTPALAPISVSSPAILRIRTASRPVPLWMAAAASLLLAAAGFAAGAWIFSRSGPGGAPEAGKVSAVQIHVIYDKGAPNPFDCTRAADDFLPQPLSVNVKTNGGV